jgi:ABC-type cobalamin/Fe3+-siderophores transport system ATPase subunit
VILEARGLAVRYPGVSIRALDGVSLTVMPGQLLAVAGPNGSGKTTLVRALLGHVAAEAGEALLDGTPVRAWKAAAIARGVGVVAQREEIVFPLTVRQTVLLGRYPHLGPLAAEGGADRAAVDAALRRCDIEWLAERRVDSLSGGEWQRVRVARALAQEPRVLVLDEPSAALDVRHEMELFELIRGLVSGGIAGLVITHQLNLAARFADRIVLLAAGRVLADGVPDAVFRPEVLARVFEWPLAVTRLPDGAPQAFAERRA